MTIRLDATYSDAGERPTVTFRRQLPHTADAVWVAISTPEGLAAWFPSPEVAFDAHVGGAIRLAGDPYDEAGATTGTVLAWDPPREFGFDWGGDRLYLRVEPDGAASVLTLVDELDEAGGAARNAAGWDACLQALEHSLAGEHADPQEGGMDAFLPILETYKGRGFPDDGWLPDPPAAEPGA